MPFDLHWQMQETKRLEQQNRDRTCPVDAKSEEKRSPNGQESQQIELQQQLLDALVTLVFQLKENNNAIAVLIEQNAMIIDSLVDQPESDEQPMTDMEGNPIRTS